MHPVLPDTNTVIDSLSSSALDLSFQEGNLSAESSDEKNDEETSDEENESVLNESELQQESLSPAVYETKENQNKSSIAGSKKRTIIRPHEKRHAPRSQTQAIGNLTAGVNKMAELQAKRLKLQEESEKKRRKERGNLLKFCREEAERNRQYELQLAKVTCRCFACHKALLLNKLS